MSPSGVKMYRKIEIDRSHISIAFEVHNDQKLIVSVISWPNLVNMHIKSIDVSIVSSGKYKCFLVCSQTEVFQHHNPYGIIYYG